jgi:predicted extracellular nuclease
VDDGTGQGNANPDRVAQAEALRHFARRVAAGLHTGRVFLTGDFNSYTQEDPLQVLYAAGYTDLQSAFNGGETTYVFDGLSGSLDHVLATDLARKMVTGADVWQINAEESVAYEYSRFNYNVTQLYAPDPYRASDHDPEVVGLDAVPGR